MKPMLAATLEDPNNLSFPLLVSPKLDGIRAMVIDGQLVSRNMKPIRNHSVQELFGRPELNGLDGELVAGDPKSADAMRATNSGVMSFDSTAEVYFHVFDDFTASGGFYERYGRIKNRVKDLRFAHLGDRLVVVRHHHITTLEQLNEHEAAFLSAGYEGLMIRSLNGPYKHGRSTAREGYLIKVKRFEDCEAVVLGFDEQMHNANELTRDALGRAKRTSHKENKHAKGTLGSLKVRAVNGSYEGVEFDVGTGFTDTERQTIWNAQEAHLGMTIKVKYFPTGTKDKPRFPTFLGFREDL